MKYVLRLVAAIPTIAAGLSIIAGFILAIDYPIVAFYAIASLYTTFICIEHYESTVHTLINVIRIICDKTPIYNQ